MIAGVLLMGLLMGLSMGPYRYAILRAHMAEVMSAFAGHRTAILEHYTLSGSWPDDRHSLISAEGAEKFVRPESVGISEGFGDWRKAVGSRLTSLLTSSRLSRDTSVRVDSPRQEEPGWFYIEDMVNSSEAWFDPNSFVVIGGAVVYALGKLSSQLGDAVFFSFRPVIPAAGSPRLVWFSCGRRPVPEGMRALGPALATIPDLKRLPLCQSMENVNGRNEETYGTGVTR